MSVDLKTIMDALDKNEVLRAHWPVVELFLYEPQEKPPLAALNLAEIHVGEGGIKILLRRA